jgi:hypothetical protein
MTSPQRSQRTVLRVIFHASVSIAFVVRCHRLPSPNYAPDDEARMSLTGTMPGKSEKATLKLAAIIGRLLVFSAKKKERVAMKRQCQIEQQRAVRQVRRIATEQNPDIQMILPLSGRHRRHVAAGRGQSAAGNGAGTTRSCAIVVRVCPAFAAASSGSAPSGHPPRSSRPLCPSDELSRPSS